jgi:hypothetical protein
MRLEDWSTLTNEGGDTHEIDIYRGNIVYRCMYLFIYPMELGLTAHA